MKQMHRVIRSAMTAALACAAIAGLAAAQDSAAPAQPLSLPSSAIVVQKDASSVISDWPAKTKKAALALIQKYGPPDGVTDKRLVWNDKDPWKEVAVRKDAVTSAKPMAHEDFVQNTISYTVPESKVADLMKFDHSLVIDKAKGTLSSHRGSEAANTLALNLANEIVTGKRDVASAKDFFKSTLMKSMAGKTSPYTETLMFTGSPKRLMPGMPGEEPLIEKNAQPLAAPVAPATPATGY